MGDFKVEPMGGGSLVRLPIRVDVSNAKTLLDCLKSALKHSPERVDVDLSSTQTLDSTALGVLIEIHKAITAEGGRLVLVAPSEAVRRVLGMTRLDRILSIEPTPIGAAASP